MAHELALITNHRVICRCGWHKKIPAKSNGAAVMVRHQQHPDEAPTHADFLEEHETCQLTDMPGNGWLYCQEHQRWVTRPETLHTNNQEELSFT